MSLWQSTMIAIARRRLVTRMMQGNPIARGLAYRFVAGDSVSSAVRRADELKGRGILASLYYLGEYVESPTSVEENVSQISEVVQSMGQTAMDVHVSIDPTQIGFSISDALGKENALKIGRLIAAQSTRGRKKLMMLDMEDYSVVDKTLDLRAQTARELRACLAQIGCSTGITIQAYLHRSNGDLKRVIAEDAAVIRLVKGAFAESPNRAWTARSDVNEQYLARARYLLSVENRAAGVYPVFATHDDAIIREVMAVAGANGWPRDAYEFEMLYGVRTPLQQQVVDHGFRLRLYLPFGTEWWPYTVRRIGENPANARFVFNALWRETRHPESVRGPKADIA